ncbi:MAG: hypothetical protein JWN93_2825 [Hyphomicrobiales bacterium]|nr:hypothetical protein [Hyphomicrobiales bacterium]
MGIEHKRDSIHPQDPSPQAAIAAAQDALRRNTSVFWVNQEKLLDSMQEFTTGWFERRHAGAHAALEASRAMARAQNPAEAFAQYQLWAKGAMERTLADAQALQKQMLKAAEAAKAQELRS